MLIRERRKLARKVPLSCSSCPIYRRVLGNFYLTCRSLIRECDYSAVFENSLFVRCNSLLPSTCCRLKNTQRSSFLTLYAIWFAILFHLLLQNGLLVAGIVYKFCTMFFHIKLFQTKDLAFDICFQMWIVHLWGSTWGFVVVGKQGSALCCYLPFMSVPCIDLRRFDIVFIKLA